MMQTVVEEAIVDVGRDMLKVALKSVFFFGDGQCMVCDGISMIGRTELVFIDVIHRNGRRGSMTQRYITENLEAHVVH